MIPPEFKIDTRELLKGKFPYAYNWYPMDEGKKEKYLRSLSPAQFQEAKAELKELSSFLMEAKAKMFEEWLSEPFHGMPESDMYSEN